MRYCWLLVCIVLLSLLVACDTTASNEESLTSSVTPVSVVVVEDVAQGVTVDGYHFLGQEDAPVVIQFYSDFF